MYQTRCRHFSGYKPCSKNADCNENCPSRDIPEKHILIIHQEAIGAVLRSTALLPSIKRKYPSSHITWVTRAPAHFILKNNPMIDRILTTSNEDLLALRALRFDVGFVVDKDLGSAGIAQYAKIKETYGFLADPVNGAVLPANEKAYSLWELGINNHKKFFENKKTETQLICEALELPYCRDEYSYSFLFEEIEEAKRRRKAWGRGKKMIVGISTGCSTKMRARKLSVEGHKKLIDKIYKRLKGKVQIVLLGGPTETEFNKKIGGKNVILSPTESGLRDGMISIEACDVIVSGDSLGMHMGIALKKWVIAWFGPTCHQEIDLFGRGEKILTQATCSPCWKRECEKTIMCYDLVSLDSISAEVEKVWLRRFLSSKRHSSGMLSSPSPSSAV